jgi:DNA-binding NtrC family response regulator
VKGNKTVAARILGLDRRTVYRKLNQRESHAPSTGIEEVASAPS